MISPRTNLTSFGVWMKTNEPIRVQLGIWDGPCTPFIFFKRKQFVRTSRLNEIPEKVRTSIRACPASIHGEKTIVLTNFCQIFFFIKSIYILLSLPDTVIQVQDNQIGNQYRVLLHYRYITA